MSFYRELMAMKEAEEIKDMVDDFDEEEFPADNSGFCEETLMGELKIDRPSASGFSAALAGSNQFANGSDENGMDTEVDLYTTFPKDKSGFEEDADLGFEDGEVVDVPVDPATVPSQAEEDDQFDDVDEDDLPLEESFSGWDDIF